MSRRTNAAAAAAREELAEAIRDLMLATGQPPVCAHDPELWVSEDADERADAAERCAGCPLTDPCHAAGEHEGWGVWGSVDRGAKAKKARAS